MDAALHIIGACADNHAHFDLSDLLLYGGAATGSIFYLKNWIKIKWNQLIKKNEKS